MCKHFVQLSISIGHFFEDQVYDWVTFQKTGSHTPTEITPKLPPEYTCNIFSFKYTSSLHLTI